MTPRGFAASQAGGAAEVGRGGMSPLGGKGDRVTQQPGPALAGEV